MSGTDTAVFGPETRGGADLDEVSDALSHLHRTPPLSVPDTAYFRPPGTAYFSTPDIAYFSTGHRLFQYPRYRLFRYRTPPISVPNWAKMRWVTSCPLAACSSLAPLVTCKGGEGGRVGGLSLIHI
eukprot:2276160-Rhodomonas_salina.1